MVYIPPQDLNKSLNLSTVEPYTPLTVEQYKPPEEETVSGRLTGILSSGSPYIEAASKKGERFAQSRGLLNSTLGAEAAQKAAIESALPIAQQEAKTLSDAGILSQQYKQNIGMVGVQADASSRLAEQEARARESLAEKEAEWKKAIDIQQQVGANIRQLADLGSTEKTNLANQTSSLSQNLQSQIGNIQVDPNLTPEAKSSSIASLQEIYEVNIRSLGSIYGVNIDWGTITTTPATPTSNASPADQVDTATNFNPMAPVFQPGMSNPVHDYTNPNYRPDNPIYFDPSYAP